MADGKIEVIIEIDDKGAVKGLKTFEGKSEKAGKKSGKEFTEGFADTAKKGFSKLGAVAAGAAAAIGAVFAGREIIQAASRQQDAVNNLNSSLRRIGQFTQETSQDLQNFASELQNVTTIGDEAALEQLALAQGFGATAEQSKAIVSAAADLSSALGIDLNAATRNVSKTLGGYAGELGEVIPELKNFTQEQLRSGDAIALIAQKFEGLAAAQTGTFSGALTQTTNLFGDLLEKIGGIITDSPLIIALINKIGEGLKIAGDQVLAFKDAFDLKEAILLTIEFGRAINTFIVAPLELLFNVGQAVFSAINLVVQETLTRFVTLAAGIDKAKAALGFGDVNQELQDFAATSNQVLTEFRDKAVQDFGDAFNFDITDKSEEFLGQFEEFVNQFQVLKEPLKLKKEDLFEDPEIIQEQANNLLEVFDGLSVNFKTNGDRIRNTAKAIGNVVQQGLAKAISGGVQAIVNSLAAGENAFKAFGNFVLGTFGDLAIQLGNTLIGAGLGVEALKALGGAAAVAAGIGLVALGAIIKSIAGGGGGGGGGANFSGTGAVGGGVTTQPSPVTEQAEETTGPSTAITLNVQGDVLDSDETGTRLAQVLSDAGAEQGIIINNVGSTV